MEDIFNRNVCYTSGEDRLFITVTGAGIYQCDPGYHVFPGKRSHYILHIVRKGKGFFRVENRLFHLSAGDIFLIVPGVDVYYEADTADPWKYYWVNFNGTEIRSLLKHTSLSLNTPVVHADNTDALCNRVLAIYEARGDSAHNTADRIGHLYLLFGELMRNAPIAASKVVLPHLNNALDYIQQHYARPLHVDEIALHVGLSRSQLYRMFVDNLGMSVNRYLNQYRIGEACRLLSRSSGTVREIAVEVGFPDALYFSRVFKEIKGEPPTQYRRRTKEAGFHP